LEREREREREWTTERVHTQLDPRLSVKKELRNDVSADGKPDLTDLDVTERVSERERNAADRQVTVTRPFRTQK
jgi:hypothetical protein